MLTLLRVFLPLWWSSRRPRRATSLKKWRAQGVFRMAITPVFKAAQMSNVSDLACCNLQRSNFFS